MKKNNVDQYLFEILSSNASCAPKKRELIRLFEELKKASLPCRELEVEDGFPACWQLFYDTYADWLSAVEWREYTGPAERLSVPEHAFTRFHFTADSLLLNVLPGAPLSDDCRTLWSAECLWQKMRLAQYVARAGDDRTARSEVENTLDALASDLLQCNEYPDRPEMSSLVRSYRLTVLGLYAELTILFHPLLHPGGYLPWQDVYHRYAASLQLDVEAWSAALQALLLLRRQEERMLSGSKEWEALRDGFVELHGQIRQMPGVWQNPIWRNALLLQPSYIYLAGKRKWKQASGLLSAYTPENLLESLKACRDYIYNSLSAYPYGYQRVVPVDDLLFVELSSWLPDGDYYDDTLPGKLRRELTQHRELCREHPMEDFSALSPGAAPWKPDAVDEAGLKKCIDLMLALLPRDPQKKPDPEAGPQLQQALCTFVQVLQEGRGSISRLPRPAHEMPLLRNSKTILSGWGYIFCRLLNGNGLKCELKDMVNFLSHIFPDHFSGNGSDTSNMQRSVPAALRSFSRQRHFSELCGLDAMRKLLNTDRYKKICDELEIAF